MTTRANKPPGRGVRRIGGGRTRAVSLTVVLSYDPDMKVLVTGGDGFIGRNLCAELAARGHEVTALSRHPDDGLPEGVSVATGDVTTYASIESAFEGQDAVVNLVALSPLFEPKGGNRMHDVVHRQGTENVVAAAETHGVPRLVQLSAMGADSDGPTAYIRAKGRAEEIIRGSDLDWVIFRPSIVFGEGGEFLEFTKKLAPPYVTPLPGGGKTPFQPIWVKDFVPMIAGAVEDERHTGETYEIGGPEPLTLAEVARRIHAAAGRPVRVIPVPMALTRVGLALAGSVPGFPMGSEQYRSLKLDSVPAHNDIDAFRVREADLKTIEEFLRERQSA